MVHVFTSGPAPGIHAPRTDKQPATHSEPYAQRASGLKQGLTAHVPRGRRSAVSNRPPAVAGLDPYPDCAVHLALMSAERGMIELLCAHNRPRKSSPARPCRRVGGAARRGRWWAMASTAPCARHCSPCRCGSHAVSVGGQQNTCKTQRPHVVVEPCRTRPRGRGRRSRLGTQQLCKPCQPGSAGDGRGAAGRRGRNSRI